jgi:tellurite resistance protein TerC
VGPESHRLAVRHEGRWFVTPLFLVFLVIGTTDVLFAFDSIPAIMGISQDPFVVLTSNVFAVLGLNSLFFALRGIMGVFKFLKHGVSVILLFIGAKMIAGAYRPVEVWFKENSFVSLIVIGTVLFVSIILSVWHSRLSGPAETKSQL